MTEGYKAEYPTGGTLVIPEGVFTVWVRAPIPLDYKPEDPFPEWKEKMVQPGQKIEIGHGEMVAWQIEKA